MIRNLLYSFSLHLLLILVVYVNFNAREFIDLNSNEPITVSFIASDQIKTSQAEEQKAVQKNKKPDPIIEKKEKTEVKKKPNVIKNKKKKTKNKKKTKKKEVAKKKPQPKKKIVKKKKEEPKKEEVQPKKTVKSHENKGSKEIIKSDQNNDNIEKTQTINLSARERFSVALQIKRCYRKAILENGEASDIATKIKVKLNLNGTFDLPSITTLNKDDFLDNEGNLQIALKNITRTFQICSPIRNLPKDKYEIWQEMDLTFDPKEN